MKKVQRRRALLAMVVVLLLAAMACLGGGNSGGNTSGNSGDSDLAATAAALEATQAALDSQPAEQPAEDQPAEQPVEEPASSGGEIDFDNLQSGDILYATDFDSEAVLDDWFYLTIPDGQEGFYSYVEGGYFGIGVEDTDTTVYYFYDPLYMPRRNADVLVETATNNVGDVRNNNISVICRASEEGWYEFSLTSSGLWYIWKYDENGYTSLANGGVPGYNKNDTEYVLSATCIGEELTFYLDGVQLKNAQISDRSFDEGGVGVSLYAENVSGVEVEFDWFQAIVP